MHQNPFQNLLPSIGQLLVDNIQYVIVAIVIVIGVAMIALGAVAHSVLYLNEKIRNLGKSDRAHFENYRKRYGQDAAVRSFRKRGKL